MTRFGPFQLDPAGDALSRDGKQIHLRPKSFALLKYLLDHPGRLITKDELLTAIWADSVVSEAALTVCLSEIRLALQDDSRTPRYIETVHRRGVRFIGTVAASPAARRRTPLVVGREAEIACLEGWFAKAQTGQRQIVFVTGDVGIGKTTMVDAFVEQAGAVEVLRGQCIEQYGAGEAYLPFLEAMGRLPGLRLQGATKERMLRAMADALETAAAERPLIVVLEDLHWADPSTVELIGYLARRREAARLLLIGTYRPVDAIVRNHPLKRVKQELQLHRLAMELPLELLSHAEVGRYVTARFGDSASGLGPAIHRRTDGHPLFMVTLIDHLLRARRIEAVDGRWDVHVSDAEIASSVPDSLREMIGQQVDALDPGERHVLEVGSAVGMTFSAAAVAGALGEDVDAVEACCDALARRGQFLITTDTDFAFRHALYQQLLYERVPVGRRARLHQRIGENEERAWGERAGEHAAELAVHFERARDHRGAVRHRRRAAENALRRSAYREVLDHLELALDAVAKLPDPGERDREELATRLVQGPVLMATRGYGAAEVEEAYLRTRSLCERIGTPSQLYEALWGLWQVTTSRAEYGPARALAAELLRIAESLDDPVGTAEAHRLLGQILLYLGELTEARAHLEESVALYDAHPSIPDHRRFGQGPGVASRAFLSLTLWTLGHADEALRRAQEGVAITRALDRPLSLSFAQTWVAWVHLLRGESPEAAHAAQSAMTLAREHGFPQRWAQAAILKGAATRDPALTREGLAAHAATGARTGRTFNLALVAEAELATGGIEAGLRAVEEALETVASTGERWWEAELHRLRGELLRAAGRPVDAEACVRSALEIARRQGARSLERRLT